MSRTRAIFGLVRCDEMDANIRFVSAIFIALMAMANLVGCRDSQDAGVDRPATDAAAKVDDDRQRPEVGLSGSRGIAGLPPSALQQYYACGADEGSCNRDPLVAASPEEAQWLQARGYPAPDQIKSSLAASTESLRLAAEESGSLVDKSLYGQALLRDGKYRDVVGSMVDSFVRDGNIYGLYLTSDAYMQSEELMNPPLAMAYLRLAYLAGDSKAGGVLEAKFGQMTPPERAFADRRAADLKRNMAPDGSWPRP